MSLDNTKENGTNIPSPETSSRHGGADSYPIYETPLRQNRSLITVLGMSIAIAAVPYGIGGPLISAIYGGGQLSLFVGLIVVLLLQTCVAVSLGELASCLPTSSGVYYWAYHLSEGKRAQNAIAYFTGWAWLVGNWAITLSVNFGFATLIVATVTSIHPDWTATSNEQLYIFFGICTITCVICTVGDRILPFVDALAAIWNLITVVVFLFALSIPAKAGRHSAPYALGHYDGTLSGYGDGFSFFIGLLPPAYTFSAIGMAVSMTEECANPAREVPWALSLSVPVGGVVAFIFILPICFTMPPLADILTAPYGQALPMIVSTVTESKALTLAVMILILLVTLLCSISITTAASRTTWALSRDQMIPLSRVWSQTNFSQPLCALGLVTVVQMLLGCIILGSSSAFTAFVSVGVVALAVSYLIPILISLLSGRKQVAKAPWKLRGYLGVVVNVVSILWISFQLVLFSMPSALPVTAVTMNYASVVLVGFGAICAIWYIIWARKNFRGPVIAVTSTQQITLIEG